MFDAVADYLAPNQHPYAADQIEMEWQTYPMAREHLQQHLPRVLDRLTSLQLRLQRRDNDIDPPLLQAAIEISTICLLRFALRHGALSDMPLAYHNEIHCLEVLENLLLIPHEQTRQLSSESWVLLILFAASHDLQQGLIGLDARGIGCNELASADEVLRIIKAQGIDLSRPYQQLLSWMIHGSTFAMVPATYLGRNIDSGALSPVLAADIIKAGQQVEKLPSQEAAELVLLATDIDTGNVARPFNDLVLQTVRLCRELHTRREQPLDTPDTALSVLDFMSNGQRRYFFEQQRFYSRYSVGRYTQRKQQNGEKLRLLLDWIEQQYQPPFTDCTGEDILEQCLRKAKQVDEMVAEQNNEREQHDS